MIADFARWVIGGFTAPQASVRRLVAADHGYDVAAQLFVLGVLIQAIALVLIADGPNSASGLPALIGNMIGGVLQFGVLVFLVLRLGRLCGGTGDLKAVVMGLAWWNVMSALLSPVLLIFMKDMPALFPQSLGAAEQAALPAPSLGMLLGMMAASVTMLWLLAHAVAAVHGFRNVWVIVGAIVGLPIAMFAILSMVAGGGA